MNINECGSTPCENSGQCTDGVDEYTCTCMPGFTGLHCETNIDECASSPCHPYGSCTDQVDDYSCSCAAGFTGRNCDVTTDECVSDPCENGGTCIEDGDGFRCECPSDIGGGTCFAVACSSGMSRDPFTFCYQSGPHGWTMLCQFSGYRVNNFLQDKFP